jgi:WD40 repeat protein/serine/threonine protein kinase
MADAKPNRKNRLLNDLGVSIETPDELLTEELATPPSIPDHTLLRRIGKGSYGEVWLAHNVMGTPRAVKVVYRHAFDSDRPYEREFAGIRRFEPVSRSHPSQLNVLHVGRDDNEGYFYYVMELADDVGKMRKEEGGVQDSLLDEGRAPTSTLVSYLPRTLRSDLQRSGRLPFEACLNIGLALATALDHLHKHGLVHRDIKPSNIVFVNGIPKLADIGLVTHLEATLSFVGTEGYLPPEGPGTPQADIFSLGKVLYEMATGRDRQEYPELPTNLIAMSASERQALGELNEIIVRACDLDWRKRYQTAADLHADLALLQSGRSVSHLRAVERTVSRLKRASVSIGAVTLLATMAWVYQSHQTEQVKKLAADNLTLAQQARASAAASRREALINLEELYVADMSSAIQAYNEGNVGRARVLLKQHFPKKDEPDLRGFEWRYQWQLTRDQSVFTFRGHKVGIAFIDISPDGKLVLSGSQDGIVKLWEYATGKELVSWDCSLTNSTGLEDVYRSVFTSDSKHLIELQWQKGPIRVWEIKSKALAETLPLVAVLRAQNISPDRKTLAVIDPQTHLVTVWDLVAHRERMKFEAPKTVRLEWSVDGTKLITEEPDRIGIWDAMTGHQVKTWDVPEHLIGIDYRIILLPGEERLITWFISCKLDNIGLFDPRQPPRPNRLIGDSDRISDVVVSSNGSLAAIGTGSHTIRLWDLASESAITTFRGHQNQLSFVRFHPLEPTILSTDEDGAIKVWRYDRIESDVFMPDTHGMVNAASFGPDARNLLVAHSDGSVCLWDPKSESLLQTLESPSTNVVRAVASSPVNGKLAWGGQQLVICDTVPSFEQAHRFEQTNLIRSLCFTSDGSTLVGGGDSGEVWFWSTDTMVLQDYIDTGLGCVPLLAISPDDRWVATACDANPIVRVWNRASREAASFSDGFGGVFVIAFSPDGKILATGSWDDHLRFYDTHSWKKQWDVLAHSGRVSALTFSSDGKTLVSGSSDNTLKFWNLATRREMGSIRCDWPVDLRFSPNSDLLIATISKDWTLPRGVRGRLRLFRSPIFSEIEAGERLQSN